MTGAVWQGGGKHLDFELALSPEAAPLLTSSVYPSKLIYLTFSSISQDSLSYRVDVRIK